jgi:hypothetical protein
MYADLTLVLMSVRAGLSARYSVGGNPDENNAQQLGAARATRRT